MIVVALLILVLFNSNTNAQIFTDTTSCIVVTFNEPMLLDNELLNPINYFVNDGKKQITVYRVGLINHIGDITVNDTSKVLLITQRLAYKNYTVKVNNVKDKAGNLIDTTVIVNFSFNGLNNNINKPTIEMKKK